MTTKQQFLNEWKNVNLSELGLVKSVFFNGLTEEAKQRVMKDYGFTNEEEAADEYFFVDSDVEVEDIEDWNEYSEEWFQNYFDDSMEYLMGEIFKRHYPYFLCHSVRGDWMGSSSYQFYTEKEVLSGDFLGEYDNTTTIVDYYNGKVLKLNESHHDVPGGHPMYLIGLTETQYDYLMRFHENYQRSLIKDFAENHIK